MWVRFLRWFEKSRFAASLGWATQRVFLKTRFARHDSRDEFHVGCSKDFTKLEKYLLSNGYETDFYCWWDEDQVFSLRKFDKDKYQYHIRLYKDGEVRAHYEYSPEARPIAHLQGKYFKARSSYFKKLMKNFIR